MTAEEKQELLNDLIAGREEIAELVAAVDPATASRAPSDGKWSVLQITEHLFLVEAGLYQLMAKGQTVDEPALNLKRERRIKQNGTDRSRPIEAPQAVIPNGRFTTVQEAVRGFTVVRNGTIAFVELCHWDLRCRLTEHPLFGTVNAYEMLLLMAVHPRRHAGQIREALSA